MLHQASQLCKDGRRGARWSTSQSVCGLAQGGCHLPCKGGTAPGLWACPARPLLPGDSACLEPGAVPGVGQGAALAAEVQAHRTRAGRRARRSAGVGLHGRGEGKARGWQERGCMGAVAGSIAACCTGCKAAPEPSAGEAWDCLAQTSNQQPARPLSIAPGRRRLRPRWRPRRQWRLRLRQHQHQQGPSGGCATAWPRCLQGNGSEGA